MKTKKLFLILLLIYGFTASGIAQSITGEVFDKVTQQTIPGANVIVVGKASFGTTTDMDGKFTIDLQNGTQINVTFIGYESQNITINPQQTFYRIELKPESTMLGDAVVIGYGTQRRKDLTGAVSSVKSEDLARAPIVSAEQAMQGRLAGVTITQNSGAPGGTANVRIRGVGTINNSDPLYVIDGVPSDNMAFINPADIENIDVLKDASASAIYGSRGANGVILVTTKQGKMGKSKINFDAYVGISQVWKKPELLNTREWYDIINEARTNGNKSPFNLIAPSDDLNHTTNWFDEVTQTGVMQNYDLSISGGTEAIKYNLSGGYLKSEGTITGSKYSRSTVRFNGTYKVKPWLNVGTNVAFMMSEKNNINENDYYYGIVYSALKLDPATPVWNNETNFYAASPYTDVYTPNAWNATHFSKTNLFKIFGNVFADVKFLNNFVYKSSFGIDTNNERESLYQPVYYLSPQLQNKESLVTRNIYQPFTWVWDNTVTYNNTFGGKHNLSVMVGTSAQENRNNFVLASKKGTPGDDITLQELGAATLGDKVDGNLTEWALFSFLGRVNYSFDGKYLFTFNFRRDGSSKFGPNNRYGNFPSFSAGWVLSEENFLKPVNFINNLKLRGGWGQIGNEKIPSYQFISTIRSHNDLSYTFGTNQAMAYGAIGVVPGNPNIKWETTTTYNAGLDFSLFNNKISGSFDYFVRKTTDILFAVPVPSYVGWGHGGTFPSPTINVGKVSNKGWEFTLTWQNTIRDFSYRISGNVSMVKNTVDYLSPSIKSFAGGSLKFGNTTRTEVGHSIGEFYGYVTDGIFQTPEEVAKSAQAETAIPGDIRFKKLTPGDKLSDADRKFIGSPHPKVSYGVNFDFSYKNFDLAIFFQGVAGNKIFNAMKYDLLDDKGEVWNRDREILNRWTGPGTSNTIPIMNASSKNNNLRVSDFYVESGAYLRLKNIQLGFTLPKTLTTKLGIDRIRIYASALNLLTFTKYSGLDPEIGYTGGTFREGVDFGTYPQARTYNFGVNLTF